MHIFHLPPLPTLLIISQESFLNPFNFSHTFLTLFSQESLLNPFFVVFGQRRADDTAPHPTMVSLEAKSAPSTPHRALPLSTPPSTTTTTTTTSAVVPPSAALGGEVPLNLVTAASRMGSPATKPLPLPPSSVIKPLSSAYQVIVFVLRGPPVMSCHPCPPSSSPVMSPSHLSCHQVIFVLGGPGSGKGTQCDKLIGEFSSQASASLVLPNRPPLIPPPLPHLPLRLDLSHHPSNSSTALSCVDRWLI